MEHLELTPDELCAVAQGLRAHICQRLYWMMSPRHPIHGEDFDDEAATLNWMVQAYSKTMMSEDTVRRVERLLVSKGHVELASNGRKLTLRGGQYVSMLEDEGVL